MTGQRYYDAYRAAKGGVTRTGALMSPWAEMPEGARAAFRAAEEAAAQGLQPAVVYGA